MTSAGGALRGTGRLFLLAIRRDRVRIAVWVAATAAVVGVSASSVADLYDSPERRLAYARLARDNAAIIVQAGPGYGLDDPTTGAILMNELGVWTLVLVAVLGIMTTVRHTRTEEESGRAELIRSAPVGRHAGAAATLLAVLAAQATVAGAVTAVVALAGYALRGAIAFGAVLLAVGLTFGAIAAVTAQVAASARVATGLALAVLGIAFVARAVGDVSAPALSWASPIHWGQAVRAFADERWVVLAVPIVSVAVLLVVATRLADHRDLGAGMLGQRPGRAEATARLVSPLALAVRLHRGSVLGWAAGIACLGVFYGVVADQAEQLLEDNPEMADFLEGLGGGSITDAFLATGLLVVGLLVSGFAVAAVLRVRTEETSGRADPLLATPTSRAEWAAGHLVVSALSVVVLMIVGGVAEGIGAAVSMGDAGHIGRLALAGLAMSPAPIVIGAFAFLLCTAVPRSALLAWAVMVLSAAIGLLAESLGLPAWVQDLSPFEHVPAMPAVDFTPVPVLVLLALSAAIASAGFAVLGRRDVGNV